MAEENEVLCAIAAATVVTVVTSGMIVARKRRRKPRVMWVRPLFKRRMEYGAYNLLMAELRNSDHNKYQGFTRLTVEDFDQLLSLVKADISGCFRYRLPIPADVRLAKTGNIVGCGSAEATM